MFLERAFGCGADRLLLRFLAWSANFILNVLACSLVFGVNVVASPRSVAVETVTVIAHVVLELAICFNVPLLPTAAVISTACGAAAPCHT